MATTRKTTNNQTTNKTDYLSYPQFNVEVIVSQEAKKSPHLIKFLLASKEEGKTLLETYPWFSAKASETVTAARTWYIGMGKSEDLDSLRLGEVLLKALRQAATNFEEIGVELPNAVFSQFGAKSVANLISTAIAGAVYPLDLMKTKPSQNEVKLKKVNIQVSRTYQDKFSTALEAYKKEVQPVLGMRQLQVLPGNIAYAETVERRARDIAKEFGLKITVMGQAELEKLGAGGILAVNQGSAREPRMIVLEYSPAGAKKTLGLIGKGVTFDTGGISIKPSSGMHEMKSDMSGSAAVLHAIAGIAAQKTKVRVIAAVGMVENMPDGKAQKPGDVYPSLKGHTVEVQNTDAEGRLVLADLLTYVEREHSPDLIVDIATLTGASVVALGHHYAGLFALNDESARYLEKASQNSHEPLWRLPVDRVYREMLKSEIADYNNIGERWGGASSAAAFLSAFLDHPEKWAHVDIAGIGILSKDLGVYPSQGSGFGVRLFCELARVLEA